MDAQEHTAPQEGQNGTRLAALRAVLSADPRPRYHSDPGRIYGLPFAGLDVRFSVSDGVLTVTGIVPLGKGENQ